MSDQFVHDDTLVAAALRLNWDHARHIETQRLHLLAIYVAIAAALGVVGVYQGDLFLRLGAIVLALCVTLIVWAMTAKLNRAFANQLLHADRCARRLAVQGFEGQDEYIALHGFIGFPSKPPSFAGMSLTVRLIFSAFYGTAALMWLALLAYGVFRFVRPEANL